MKFGRADSQVVPAAGVSSQSVSRLLQLQLNSDLRTENTLVTDPHWSFSPLSSRYSQVTANYCLADSCWAETEGCVGPRFLPEIFQKCPFYHQ